MNADKKAKPEIDGAAMSVLTEHRGGDVINDLSAAFREAAGAAQMVGKAATVTITFKFSPPQKTAGALIVSDEITSKLPKAAPRGSIFFADDQNNLVRNDPNQEELPLRIIDQETETEPLKVVA